MVLENGSPCLEVIVPAWKDVTFSIPVTSVPGDILRSAKRFPDNSLRFYAQVNLDAHDVRELSVTNIEAFDITEVFKVKDIKKDVLPISP
jgi:hypothetical protein